MIHDHDQFEVDIDLDETDVSKAPVPTRPAIPSLFDDEEEERTQEVLEFQQAQLLKAMAGSDKKAGSNKPLPPPPPLPSFTPEPNSDDELTISASSNDEVLPVFLPSPPSPARPRRATPAFPEAGKLPLTPNPIPADLFSDLSDENSGESNALPIFERPKPATSPPPIEPITQGLPVSPPPSNPGSSTGERRRRFATGYTAGMQPLDGSKFSHSEERVSGGKRRRRGEEAPVVVVRGPAPMASSKRVVRRWFQLSLRDVLLLMLIVLLGLGMYLGWRIYRDWQHTSDIGLVNEARKQIDQARSSAIEDNQPKKEKDIP